MRHLQLFSVQLLEVTSLQRLTQEAPNLSTLRLAGIDFLTPRSYTQAAQEQVAKAMPILLEQLPKLTVLSLDFPLSDAALLKTSTMQRLQQVLLEETGYVPLGDLRHLASSVTELQLLGCGSNDRPGLPSQLPQLSGLRHLDLSHCTVAPSVLGSLKQLQVLHLERCQLLPTEANPQSTAALLKALPELTSLQDAQLILHGLDTVNIAPQHFAALTESQYVTHLALSHDSQKAFPQGAAKYMFPPNRQMQSLRHLEISTSGSGQVDPVEWCLTSADVSRIINCCPQLWYLDISSSVEPDADLLVLLQLPESCTSLLVGGAAFTDAVAPVVAQMTQLKFVAWSWSPGLTDAGLEQLVRLELDRLLVSHCSLSEQISAGAVWTSGQTPTR